MPAWVREHILINILATFMRTMENAVGAGGVSKKATIYWLLGDGVGPIVGQGILEELP